MPIHLYWGDDGAALQRAIDQLVANHLDPSWATINLSRLDGQDAAQAARALEESRTPPFGAGARLVVLQRSPFCQSCPSELASLLEGAAALIPPETHLVLVSPGKPDARLRTTKLLRSLVKAGKAEERSFSLPAVWDGAGQLELVQRTARELGLRLEAGVAEALCGAIGSDSSRLAAELGKLALYQDGGTQPADGDGQVVISEAAVRALIGGRTTSSLAVGDALLAGQAAEAIARLDALLDANEPALRIVATLTGQLRGWLWVALLDRAGESDAATIAKAAGIANPRRIYVMRKQIRGVSPERLLALLGRLLEVEAALKRGSDAGEAFRDGFLLLPSLR